MKTIVFALDGTLSEEKEPIDDEMASLLAKLLRTNNVAIISGASWKQYESNIVAKIPNDANSSRLYLIPTSGAALYQVWGKYGWVATYQIKLSKKDKAYKAIEEAIKETAFEQPKKLWGKQIEDRDGQITFSALGQKAPQDEKDAFDPGAKKRTVLAECIARKLPEFEVRVAGSTSIDISLLGVNKKYGIDEMMKRLHISKDDVFYVGGCIFKGGSGYVAIEMGLDYIDVKSVDETKNWIRQFLDASEKSSLEKTG